MVMLYAYQRLELSQSLDELRHNGLSADETERVMPYARLLDLSNVGTWYLITSTCSFMVAMLNSFQCVRPRCPPLWLVCVWPRVTSRKLL